MQILTVGQLCDYFYLIVNTYTSLKKWKFFMLDKLNFVSNYKNKYLFF